MTASCFIYVRFIYRNNPLELAPSHMRGLPQRHRASPSAAMDELNILLLSYILAPLREIVK